MVNIQSLCVTVTLLGSYAAALPTNIVLMNNGVTSTLAERCIPDHPTSCGAGSMKREVSVKRCIPDDPTSCGPGDFGKRDIPVKRCIPDDPTSIDVGSHTKRSSRLLVAAISGGAVIPPMTGAVATHRGNFHYTMAIPTAFYVLPWVFPVYANTVSKKFLDGDLHTDLNLKWKSCSGGKGCSMRNGTKRVKATAERVETVNATPSLTDISLVFE